jgi:hypothetical protein
MNNFFYSSDGNFYKLQTIENFENTGNTEKPFFIKFKLFSDYGEALDNNDISLPNCKNCIRENGNGWGGNELCLYKLGDNGNISTEEIPYILQNIGKEGTNFTEGKELGFFGGKLYPGSYILKFKEIVNFKPEEMGIIIMFDDDKNDINTDNKVLFYSRSSRDKNDIVNQYHRKVININNDLSNLYKDYNNLDGFMRDYNGNYIFTIEDPNKKVEEEIMTTKPMTTKPINSKANQEEKEEKEIEFIKDKLENIKKEEENEKKLFETEVVTYWPETKKYDIKVILFDDHGEVINHSSDLPYCYDCVRKDGDNWHSGEDLRDEKINLGNLVSIVQYDNDTKRVDIDEKFKNMGDINFKNKKKISNEINGYLYPNKYAIKFNNIVRYPEEMGLIVYKDDEVIFYSRSSRSMHGGINQKNRKEGQFMKNINDIDYFYIGNPSVETNDYKKFKQKKKYLNTKN